MAAAHTDSVVNGSVPPTEATQLQQELAETTTAATPAVDSTAATAAAEELTPAAATTMQPEASVREDTTSIESPPENGLSEKWPGWPGDCVFRFIVPVLKVGSIIGRKGELIKKICEETRARVRVLDGVSGTPDRVVLISGKEELEAPLSPAMDAVLRVFKRVHGLSDTEGDGKTSGAVGASFCSVRLLVASTQAISLIGKNGSVIKSIQESSGSSARVLSGEEVPYYVAADERIVELQGETLKVQKALESVLGHLRKFLVDHTVLPLFEKNYATAMTQEQQAGSWSEKSSMYASSQSGIKSDYSLPMKREPVFHDRESQLETQIASSGLSAYAQDPAISALRSSGLSRTGTPIVTQVVQTMQIPLSYAEDIIGIEGTNIGYIRRTSGALLTVQESRALPDEITVEIKGNELQVHTAQQLIQEFISNHRESVASSYGKMDTGYRPSYSQLGNSGYSNSSLSGQPYGGYGSSGVGGYGSFRP